MAVKVVIFLAVVLVLTIGTHMLFYKAVVRVFEIAGPVLKTSLFFVLLLLSLSFMASFFLLQWQENYITIGFYKFSAIWVGLFLNLLPAVLVSWLVIAAIRMSGGHPPTRWIAAACIFAALIYSVYGVWNAFHPRIKKLEVQIENLPRQWKNKTIIQLSDVHLGHFYGTEFLNNLVRKVNALNPEVVFITGDLFDGMAATISHFATGLNQLRATKGVFFVTGNHETYVGLNRAHNALKKTNIQILHNEIIELDGLQILGISYPGIRGVHEIRGLEKLSQNSSNKMPRILLFHTPTNIRLKGADGVDYHFATYWVPDTSYALNKEIGADLQLSGHSHAGQLFPFGYLTKLIYKGYDYGFHRLSRFAIYTTSGVGTWGPPMRTGNSPEIVVLNLK